MWEVAYDGVDATANGFPPFGYPKSVYHSIRGDEEAAKRAFKSSTRTMFVVGGCFAGVVGGPPGVYVGAVAGGIAADKVFSYGEGRPSGVFASIDKAKNG